MRRVDEHFRIYADRNGRLYAESFCDRIEDEQLLLRLDVEQQNLSAERFFHLALGFADTTEHYVFARVARLQGAKQLASRDDVEAGPQLPQQRENGNAGVRLDAVVKARVDRAHCGMKLIELRPDPGGAVHVAGRSDLAGNRFERDLLEARAILAPGRLFGRCVRLLASSRSRV